MIQFVGVNELSCYELLCYLYFNRVVALTVVMSCEGQFVYAKEALPRQARALGVDLPAAGYEELQVRKLPQQVKYRTTI